MSKSTKTKSTKPAAKKRGSTAEAPAKDIGRAKTRDPKTPRARDPRLPKPGTVLKRAWHGKTYEVIVNADDFTYAGEAYRSLTAVARAITKAKAINGVAWFGLAPRPPAKGTKETKTAATGETK
jgi:hypothetical protein